MTTNPAFRQSVPAGEAVAPGHTIVAAARPPRRLPEGEALPPEDYRRLVGVLEAIDRASDLLTFREGLLRALQSWFGYSTLAVLHGPTLAEAMLEGRGIKSGYSQAFLDEYATRWVSADPFLTPKAWRLLTDQGVVTLHHLRPQDVPAQRDYVEHFLKPNGILDKVGMMVDGGPADVLYIGMAVFDTPRAPARDLAVFQVLRRHLAPLVADQLARDRASAEARRAWRLTPREREVAELAAQGLTNQQIAHRLFVSLDTVKKHLTRVLAVTGCSSRTQLAVRWQQKAYIHGTGSPDNAPSPE
jgi:DNA-binding CsgD family transcriptional regulator